MTDATADASLDPSAYAPYRNPRDYILSWTDVIWIEKALGRLDEHYDANIQVHTAYGETYDYTNVIANSVQKMHAFPKRWRRERRGRDLGTTRPQRIHQFPSRLQDGNT